MGLFAKISVPGIDSPVVLGSVHTLCTNAVAIQEYIGIHPAIVAGDQNWNVCREWGLRPATTSTKATWFESTPPNGGGNTGARRPHGTSCALAAHLGPGQRLSPVDTLDGPRRALHTIAC